MKTVKEWQQDIIKITIRINQDYPELSKYTRELTLKNSKREHDSVKKNELIAYHISLVDLIKKYTKKRRETYISQSFDNSNFPTAEEIMYQEMNGDCNNKTPKGKVDSKDIKNNTRR
jgi:hypothetical protein